MKKKKLKVILFFLLPILVIIFNIAFVEIHKSYYNKKLSPVILVPGSSASVDRFDKTTETINKHTKHHHSLLKIKVNKNHKLHITGKINPNDKEPFVVIGFQNNKDGYRNIKEQARQYELAFHWLYKKYHFTTFKAIGHSNGGLILTLWLETAYHRNYGKYPKIKKLITVGTPFNFEENSISHETLMLHDLRKNRNKLPSNLRVMSVGGTSSYESDGIVREGSYRCAKYVFQKRVKKFTMITITGDDSKHSDLPTNQQVISIMEQHLIDDKSAKLYQLKQEESQDENNE